MKPSRSNKPNAKRSRFHTKYKHWRSGKEMIAEQYGYKAWPF